MPPKSGAERTKEYRLRMKIKKQNKENTDINIIPKSTAKSGAQRAREYRERKKMNIKRCAIFNYLSIIFRLKNV